VIRLLLLTIYAPSHEDFDLTDEIETNDNVNSIKEERCMINFMLWFVQAGLVELAVSQWWR